MRKRFDGQLGLGQLPIEATYINPKSKNSLDQLLAALKAIYCNKKYNQEIFGILEGHINSGKKNTGRTGMDLWSIFVLAQVRLCLNLSYDVLRIDRVSFAGLTKKNLPRGNWRLLTEQEIINLKNV